MIMVGDDSFNSFMETLADSASQEDANDIADAFFEKVSKIRDGADMRYSTILVAISFIISRVVATSPNPKSPVDVLMIVNSLVMATESHEVTVN